MAPKPAMSITLPRNFTYHHSEADAPVTPAPQAQENDEEVSAPPPPPRQTFKIRRRKADSVPRDIISEIEGDGLPTIEMTEADMGNSPESAPDPMPGYLAPQATRLPLLSPPKTPVEQITEYSFDSKDADWSTFRMNPIERPESACSGFSDSSASSYSGSLRSFPSLGSLGATTGSCTSPESDTYDPFSLQDAKGLPVFSPDINASSPIAKRVKTEKEARWTLEMDGHLWATYMNYLNDPELTPFKMLPGTAPPLGVCGKVAREAKHSWKHGRIMGLSLNEGRRKGLPTFDQTGQNTDRVSPKTWSHWPCSESGTRKRLRKLCKRKPSLSAHYQRMMQTRTPSPFSSSSPRSHSDAQPSSFFSGRTMTQSLAEAAPPSIPSDATAVPNSEAPSNPRRPSVEKPDGWYQRIGRARAHQKSQSLHFAIGEYSGQLASPFTSTSEEDRPAPSNSYAVQSLGRGSIPRIGDEPALKSPLELHAPKPTSRSLKRRFNILDESLDNVDRLERLFSNPQAEPTRPVRDRAFSLGAVYNSSRSFQRQTSDEPMPDVPPIPTHIRSSANETARLGSPFAAPNAHQHNTFPRRITPLGSELPAFRPNMSLEGRFRELAAQEARRQ